MTGERFCGCGCGASLAGLRADAAYASEACSKRARRAASPDKARTGEHPLQAVRDQAALDKHTRDLNGLIRQAIIDAIKTRGECHADDLHDLYPVGEVDRCRELATRQFASLRSGRNPLIVERERRASTIPARKRAKSGVYVFTQYGRERSGITGVDVDHHGDGEGALSIGVDAPAVGVDPGDPGPIPAGAAGVGTHPSSDTKCDEVSSPPLTADAGPSPDSSPEQLFPTLPSAYADVWEGEAA